ncbi:hypothetical protein ACH5RR_019342 [Cinchona calisaya]|uniref:WIYLD domain-containing protein n=1 Tax=Cinchona calisaya TaxID=153742 RepID=A0ABD2ZUA7_9GENT
MAPRRRPKKARNTRIDAAIDAMTKTYGFSEEIVKRVAKQLLKEYEGDQGDEGWFFIEQYSYQELIDAILRDQEQNDQDNPLSDQKEDASPENNSLPDEMAEDHALADDVGPFVENGLETNYREDVNHLLPADKCGKHRKDIGLYESSSQEERAIANCHNDVESNSRANRLMVSPPPLPPTTPLGTSLPSQSEKSPVLSPSSRIPSPPRVNSVGSKRRPPFNGWIESDGEEEVDDFMELTPATKWENFELWDR